MSLPVLPSRSRSLVPPMLKSSSGMSSLTGSNTVLLRTIPTFVLDPSGFLLKPKLIVSLFFIRQLIILKKGLEFVRTMRQRICIIFVISFKDK